MHALVAAASEIPFAVGQVLEDGRDRVRLSPHGQPHAGGQPAAIGQQDPQVLDFVYRVEAGGLIERHAVRLESAASEGPGAADHSSSAGAKAFVGSTDFLAISPF